MTSDDIVTMIDNNRTACPKCGHVLEYLAWVNMHDGDTLCPAGSRDDIHALPPHTYCYECKIMDAHGITQREYQDRIEIARADEQISDMKDGAA